MTSLERASTIETIETGFSPDNSFVPHLPTHVQDGVSNMKLTEVLQDWTGSITDFRGLQGLFTCMTPLTLEEGVVGSENAPRTLWDQLEPVLHHESFSQLSRDKQETVAGAVGTVLWILANAPQERVVHRGESRDVSQRVRDAADEAYRRLETSIESMPRPSRALPGGKTALRISQSLVAASLLVGCTTAPKAVSAVEILSNENRPKVVLDSGTEAVGFSTVPAEQPSPIVIDNTPTKVESPTPPATATPTETETQEPTPLKTETKIASSTPSPTIEASPSPAEAPKKQELPSWAKELFYLEIPKWGINITSLPKAERTKVKITRDTRYFGGSNPSDTITKFQETGRYLVGWGFDQSRNGMSLFPESALEMEEDINMWFPDATPAEKTALKLRYMGISKTVMNIFDDVDANIYMSANDALYIGKYGDNIEALIAETPGTMKKGTKFISVIKVLSIPVSPLP